MENQAVGMLLVEQNANIALELADHMNMKNAYLTLPSPFPVEHRLVYIWPVLRWPGYDQDQGIIGLELGRAIDLILSLHPDKRGLIRSVSYKRTELLLRHGLSPRLFEHNRSEPFDHAIKRLASTLAGVLVSPRATEGIDLKGDHSEFQIFLKLPFKLLGDDRPYFLTSQPTPPPNVSPAMPVLEITPAGTAKPYKWVSRSRSPSVAPPCTLTVRFFPSTRIPLMPDRSITIPSSQSAFPPTL